SFKIRPLRSIGGGIGSAADTINTNQLGTGATERDLKFQTPRLRFAAPHQKGIYENQNSPRQLPRLKESDQRQDTSGGSHYGLPDLTFNLRRDSGAVFGL